MNSESQPGTQSLAIGTCPLCDGTGWMRIVAKETVPQGGMVIEVKEVPRVVRCVCRTQKRAAEQKQHPGGFEPVGEIVHRSASSIHHSEFHISRLFRARPKLRDFFEPNDLMVGELVLGHVGEAQAIKLDEIAQTLWPEIYKQGDAERENLERSIKGIVSKLRRRPIALRIISNRHKPYGYFMAETPEEWLAYRAELWKHTRSWLELLHQTGEDAWLEEQLGQLRLAWTKQSADSADIAEVKA